MYERELETVQDIIENRLGRGWTTDASRGFLEEEITNVSPSDVFLTEGRTLKLEGLNLGELYEAEMWITKQQMGSSADRQQEAGLALRRAVQKMGEALKDEATADKFYEGLARNLRDAGRPELAEQILEIDRQEKTHKKKIEGVLQEVQTMSQWPDIKLPKFELPKVEWPKFGKDAKAAEEQRSTERCPILEAQTVTDLKSVMQPFKAQFQSGQIDSERFAELKRRYNKRMAELKLKEVGRQ
jgi:rubrerythrin